MNVESSVIPLLASPPRSASAIARSLKKRRGGRAIKKISRSLRCSRGRGGFPIENKKENHPVCAEQGSFATSYSTAQPPLLAVMQGGEYASACNSFTGSMTADSITVTTSPLQCRGDAV